MQPNEAVRRQATDVLQAQPDSVAQGVDQETNEQDGCGKDEWQSCQDLLPRCRRLILPVMDLPIPSSARSRPGRLPSSIWWNSSPLCDRIVPLLACLLDKRYGAVLQFALCLTHGVQPGV